VYVHVILNVIVIEQQTMGVQACVILNVIVI
jgi:hypothetical protein